ncbi:MAG: carboxypeptidase-like regulatory domain-containing protein [Bacteroidales bacterium]|nr:carboxypeptidase-like regulatory domain-containing protein [Bacteroidales bacterium]
MGKCFVCIGLLLVTVAIHPVIAQEECLIKGFITDENQAPVAGASIVNLSARKGVLSNQSGNFELKVPAHKEIIIEISFLGYKKITKTLTLLPGQVVEINQQLEPDRELLDEVIIESKFEKAGSLERINLKSIDNIPMPSGGIESVLITLGASIRNEMSSQYSVRGGNYDENLIYVNDIEIYRPLLIRSGQQEGLSFINSSLVSSIQFSAGGFEAQYGDKMSSVLDIKYKKPDRYGGSVMASLLGASIHLEGASKNQRFTHISGLRYKTNQYMLSSLEAKGDYKPKYLDFQTFLTYYMTKKIEVSLLGNISRNQFTVIPTEKETSFGTYQQVLTLKIFYEGQEVDLFNTYLGAATINYQPSKNLNLKLIGSTFNTNESVCYDIMGQYWINQLDNTIGSETAGDSILNIGVGTNLQHARNNLDAYVYNISHKGSFYYGNHNLKWGIAWQRERIFDDIREWEMIDSAGYSIPNSDKIIQMYRFTSGKNRLLSNRFSAYLQNVFNGKATFGEWFLSAGMRLQYWDANGQLLASPRILITLNPFWDRQISFHAAAGLYYQPPFYRELIDPEGNLYKNLHAQESIHYLLGSDYQFRAWDRPFKFTMEVYYKYLAHLIPYKTEDVSIQYLPQYHARGYAVGVEFKINGEFVKEAESWATLSIMETKEDVYNDYYVKTDGTVIYPGYYSRPTNQLVNFGLFFQDYFPNNPDYKVHLTLFYGSRLPFGSPDYERPSENYLMKSYKRIDIGLSKSLISRKKRPGSRIYTVLKDAWINVEIFNLFNFKNQASYQWIRTVSNQEGLPNTFAIPNNLTGILFNIRLSARF